MIKLILFDIGGVICEDRRDQFLKKFTKHTRLSLKVLHKRTFPGIWHLHDKGLVTKKQAWAKILKTIPNSNTLPKQFTEAGNQFVKRKDMIALVKQLKKKHKGKINIGDLSNMSAQMHTSLAKKKFPFTLFSPRFLSYRLHMRKPEVQIYKHIMKKTKHKPNEILFIDDQVRNLKPAQRLGWKTIHFTSVHSLKKQLKLLGLV